MFIYGAVWVCNCDTKLQCTVGFESKGSYINHNNMLISVSIRNKFYTSRVNDMQRSVVDVNNRGGVLEDVLGLEDVLEDTF